MEKSEREEILSVIFKEQIALAKSDISEVRKTSQNRFDEIRALLAKLKERVSKNIVTDETKKNLCRLKNALV